jgi:hypothetical protein
VQIEVGLGDADARVRRGKAPARSLSVGHCFSHPTVLGTDTAFKSPHKSTRSRFGLTLS